MAANLILFDLDGTLVDTAPVADLRRLRKWGDCLKNKGLTRPFPGISDLIAGLRRAGAKIAVVTTSVSFYAEGMLRHHGLPYDTLVAYHDVRMPKPAPDGYLEALRRLNCSADCAMGVGDEIRDAVALHAAGVRSIKADWNPATEADHRWTFTAQYPKDVMMLAGLN